MFLYKNNIFGSKCSIQVNHKDGIKHNNDLTNLEWVIQQGNCLHAYQTGLRTDNTPILITCANTGAEQIVYSMAEAGRLLRNVTTAAIHFVLNRRKTNAPYKGYYIKYADGRLTQRWYL